MADRKHPLEGKPFTLARWRVDPNRREEFIEAWSALGQSFLDLPYRPKWGMLLESVEEDGLFYSFGPWGSMDDLRDTRDDPESQKALQRVAELCIEAEPGMTFRAVKRMS